MPTNYCRYTVNTYTHYCFVLDVYVFTHGNKQYDKKECSGEGN